MDWLTAKPKRLLANTAVASLAAGFPAGAALAVVGGMLHSQEHSVGAWLRGIASGLLFGPALIFLFGALYLVPLLVLLRRAGYAGPGSAISLSLVPVALLFGDSVRAGLVGLFLAIPAVLVFCHRAYSGATAGH